MMTLNIKCNATFILKRSFWHILDGLVTKYSMWCAYLRQGKINIWLTYVGIKIMQGDTNILKYLYEGIQNLGEYKYIKIFVSPGIQIF